MSLRVSAWICAAPAIAVATVVACSHKITDHAPALDPFSDGYTFGEFNQFPGWETDAHDGETKGDTSLDTFADSASKSDVGAEAESAIEADAGADSDLEAESDADDGAEVDDTFDATPVVDECGPPFTTSTADAGSCAATIQSWADEGHTHYAPPTIIDYCTKPPNSGPHYYIWASYRSYDRPIAYEYLVHDLEHGAVDVYYKCAAGSTCPTLASELQAIIDARPVDPLCDPDSGVSRRVILSPDPTLTTLVAAAAWGWTYTADCVDGSTLGAFIDAHYAMAVENFCADGIVPP
jgi:hypothetical protein